MARIANISAPSTTTTDEPPVEPVDLRVGRTLFVSTEGLGGLPANLTNHYNDINTAIGAVTSVNDVIIVYPISSGDGDFSGSWNVSAEIAAPSVLNIHCYSRYTNLVFNGGLSGCTDLNISGNGYVQFNNLFTEVFTCTCRSGVFQGQPDIFADAGIWNFECLETWSMPVLDISNNLTLHVRANTIYNSLTTLANPQGCDVSFMSDKYYGSLIIDDSANENWSYVINSNICYSGSVEGHFLDAGGATDISKKLTITGDMYHFGNEVMIKLACLWKKSEGDITHYIQNNNVSTELIPVIELNNTGDGETGIILKGCNVISYNGQRNAGMIRNNNALGNNYVQIDSANFWIDDGVGDTTVITSAVAGQTVIGFAGMAHINFNDWFDANTANAIATGTMELIPNFKV